MVTKKMVSLFLTVVMLATAMLPAFGLEAVAPKVAAAAPPEESNLPIVGTEPYVVSIQNENDPNGNPGFEELSGTWQGSSDLGIHYQDPITQKTLGRYGEDGGEAIIQVYLEEAGIYRFEYFVSGFADETQKDTNCMELFVTDINNKTNQVSLDLSDSRLQGFQNVGEYEFPQGEIAIKITAPAGQGMLRFSAARFTKLSAPTEEPTATPVPEAGPKVPVIDSDEYIVSIKSETDPKWNDGFFEISGFWSGSTKSEEGIHYQDPVTGKTLGRF